MASFSPAEVNLIPNIGVMTTMMVVFALNLYIVKKFMLTPYLKLRDRRDSLTSGSQEQVKSIRENLTQMQQKIDASIRDAITAAKASAESQRLQAVQQGDQVIHAAKLEAAAGLKQTREKIAQRIIEQRSKLPHQINELGQLVYKQVME